MRPSSSLIKEPGVEQGIPRGRDLFTFVTSAASHMMRTLQKPRKSRPSKRQVNHRRFLHNMIHRKFAEIEAANQQLSSAIFSREGEGTQASSPVYVSADQSDGTPGEESSTDKLPATLSSVTTSLSLSLFSPDNTIPSNQQEEQRNLWTFNLHLEGPGETADLPYCHAFNADMYDVDTDASQHAFQRGGWSTAEQEKCTNWCSFDKHGQGLEAHPFRNLQLEPVKTDSFTKYTDNILDENDSSLAENMKKCEAIRNSPEPDPNQRHSAASLTPYIQAPNFNPAPTPPLEPQSFSFCAFEIQTAADSHCSLTDMSQIQVNPQAGTTNSFYLTESDTREGVACRDSLHPAETVWAPPNDDVNCEMQLGDTFLNAAFDKSNYGTASLQCRTAGIKRNTGMGGFHCTNRSDLDYRPSSYPRLDALQKIRVNDGRGSGHAARDVGITDSDPACISKTKTAVLSSETEGNDTCKNYMTGYDSCAIAGLDFPSSVNGSQGDAECTLRGGELQETGLEVQGIVSSACLNPPFVFGSVLGHSPVSSGNLFESQNLTSSPNSRNKTVSSCMGGGGYQNHTPFMDVAKFQSQNPCARQILTPPLEDYWLFDSILGEHET